MIKKPQKPNDLSPTALSQIQSDMTVAHDDHEKNLLRTALYKTNDNETSHDLVQTTFLKTLLYLQKGGKIRLMRCFLNHILSNLIIDEYRTRSRKNNILSLDTLLENGFDPSYNEYEKQIQIIDGKAIIALIPLLPKKYALVIHLRYLKGLSLKEMATITHQSENTVAVQAHRGLEKLQKICCEHFLLPA